jgi:hypothetical protein
VKRRRRFSEAALEFVGRRWAATFAACAAYDLRAFPEASRRRTEGAGGPLSDLADNSAATPS